MKRISSFIFFLILISNILSAQDHLPTFNYLTVSPKTVKNNDSIEITINAYDSIYGIKVVGVSIYDPQNQFVDQTGSWSEGVQNNLYTMKYIIPKWAASGVYKLKDLVIINNVDSIFHENADIDSFTVVSSTPDVTPPTISKVKVYPTTLNISDTLTCEFEAKDEVSGLAFVWVTLFDPNNWPSVSNIHYFNTMESFGNDRFRLREVIPDQAMKGNWHLELGILDNADNGFQYIDTTKILINGISPDISPPIINSLTVFPDTITKSDSLHVIINAEDNESGINTTRKYELLELVDEAGNYWSAGYISLNFVVKNKYLITIPYWEVPEYMKNKNLFVRVWLYDNAGNGVSYDDTNKIFFPLYLHLSTNSVFIPNEGGTRNVQVFGKDNWLIDSDADWLIVERINDEIIISAKANPVETDRYATVKVSCTGETDQIINVTQDIYPTNINEIEGSSVSFFPNPVRTTLYLNGLSEISSVSIFDLNGRLVLKPQITNNRIDVNSLENGIYLIKLSDKEGDFVAKFIKQ
jgi:hypothetical protein